MAKLKKLYISLISMLCGFLICYCWRYLTVARSGIVFRNSDSSWIAPTVPDIIFKLSQEDPILINYIRKYWLLGPSGKPLSLKDPNKIHYSELGQSQKVDEILKGKVRGVFVECGAAYGEEFSNSLFFEKSRNWTGILIEANPVMFREILTKNRSATLLNACLSPEPKVTRLNFTLGKWWGGLEGLMESAHAKHHTARGAFTQSKEIICFPLYSVLQAMGTTHVDYLSLDVEGAELSILETLPKDKVDINAITVEYRVVNCPKCSQEKAQKVRRYFKSLSRNYEEIPTRFSNVDLTFHGVEHLKSQ